MVLLGSWRLRQHLSYGTNGRVVSPIALGDSPIQNRFRPLAHPTGRFGFLHPHWRQDGQDVRAGDVGNQLVPNHGVSIGGERTGPLGGVFRVRPAWAAQFDHDFHRCSEGRRGRSLAGCDRLAFLRQRIAAFPDHPGVGQGVLACLRQGNGRVPAEAQISAFAVNGNPLEPILGSGSFYP